MKILIGVLTALDWALRATVLRSLYANATDGDRMALDQNTRKHSWVLVLASPAILLVFLAVKYGGGNTQAVILYVSIGAQVAGLAWFVITFAALPIRHLAAAMATTLLMFTSFMGGLYGLATLVIMTESPFAAMFVVLVFGALWAAATIYDSADLLKLGLHERQLLSAEATLRIEEQQKEIVLLLRAMAKKMDAEDKESKPPSSG